MRASLLISLAIGTLVAAAPADEEEDRPSPSLGMRLHIVPTPIRSYRLLAMSRDNDGFI